RAGSNADRLPPSIAAGEPGSGDDSAVTTGAIAELAQLPALLLTELRSGRANVNPAFDINQPMPPPVAPNPNEPVQIAGRDVNWVRQQYDFPMAALKIAMRQAKLPPASTTTVLEVVLVRQEKDSGGEWGNEREVPFIKTFPLQRVPDAREPNNPQLQNYINWAITNFPNIVRPPFYQVLGGDDPTLAAPEAPPEGVVPGMPGGPFNPAEWLDTPPAQRNPPVGELTPEQRRAIQEEQARRREQQRQSRPQPSGPSGPGGGRGGRGGGAGEFGDFAPQDDDRPPFLLLQQRRPGGGPGGFPHSEFGEFPGEYFDEFGGQGMGGWQPGAPQALQFGPLPQPVPFNPAQANEFTGWIYDETAVAGKTYRYAIRYRMLNPLFGTFNIARDPADAQKLLLESPLSAWSEEIVIPSTLHLFVERRVAANARELRMKIFKWEQGAWQAAVTSVSSGDPIAVTENGIDFSTGWTMVDVRVDPADAARTYVLLLDPTGNLVRRDVEADLTDATRRDIEAQITAAAAARAAVAP
ncbi:MAG TPA: hypothetical protein PKB10_08555, partial [Tepidisphaeraceae bacterium]|nr:hypothetical protein [Tepidisphaeraceae bacterium]